MATAKYKRNSRGRFEAKIWDGTYNDDGTKHRKLISSGKSSADLERKVAEFVAARDSKQATVYSDLTFYEYALKWLEVSKATKEKNTQEMYYYIITGNFSELDLPITQIRHSHLQEVINRHSEHPRSCEQIALTFKQIIKSAIRERILPQNALEDICSDISMPKYIKPEKRPLTELEKQAIQDAELDDMKRFLLDVLFYCGVRRGEAIALQVSDFDFKKNVVSVSKVIIFTRGGSELKPYPKSDNGIRTIPLSKEAVEHLRPYVEQCQDEFLIHGKTSNMMTANAFRRMWESITTSLNKAVGYNPYKRDRGEPPIDDLTPHIFRHNFCTTLCYRVPEISTKMIAKILGDKEKMVLDVYSHIVMDKENIEDVMADLTLT
ncbi:MAG: site-specific integrase [Lachnospiraceae bacterium]|nr:site-specific integrase [Lachnospiraceae bacterium]